jgi:hypothetical protein
MDKKKFNMACITSGAITGSFTAIILCFKYFGVIPGILMVVGLLVFILVYYHEQVEDFLI